jgi:hypothetical protein
MYICLLIRNNYTQNRNKYHLSIKNANNDVYKMYLMQISGKKIKRERREESGWLGSG